MTSGRSDLTDVCVEFRAGTAKAILVRDGDTEVWLPRSLIEIEGEELRGCAITVTLQEPFAQDKGLI